MARALQTLALVLVALATVAVAGSADAATASECQVKIADLRAATLEATFTSQNAAKDQAGLVAKLDSAATKVDQGKPADALQSLTQFRDKVVSLNGQGKIDSADAQALVAGANDAITCVQSASA